MSLVEDVRRYRLDDLRRFASALAAGLGVAPARASALASHLLWFDAAGATTLGIVTLAELLDRIESGAIDRKSEGAVVSEKGSTTVFDARHGIALLALDRAGGLATEKARDTGVGLVRVRNLAETASAAGVAAEMAIGPVAAMVLGPGPTSSIALPAPGGLPAVFDPALGTSGGSRAIEALAAPWAAVLAPDGGWLVAAISVNALETLSTFHERVADALNGLDESAGRLLPGPWESRRRGVREHGLSVPPATWGPLALLAERFGVALPPPLA